MRKYFCMYVLAAVLLAVTFMVAPATFAQDKVITLRYSTLMPPGDPMAVLGEEWCKEVEKRTGGKVKVRFYPGSVLSAPFKTYESVVNGVVDVGNTVMGYTPGRFPLMEGIYTNPFPYPTALSATKIANEVYAKFKPKELDDVKVMFLWATTATVPIHAVRKPVTKVEDLKGMKIRCMEGNAYIVRSFGGVPVAMPQPEIYDALSKGILDGVTSSYMTAKSFKTIEVLKYSTEIEGAAFSALGIVAMNKNKWNSISPEHQKVIEQINQEWLEKDGMLEDKLEKEGKEYAISKGIKVTKLSPEDQAKWDAVARTLYDQYLAKTKQKNLPGDELVKYVRERLKKGQ
jgi:TRAP-type C4-dicarboxylate transport system substrate-binding protein